MNGQVTGLKGDTIALAGSAPLLLTPSPLGISVPPEGRLSLKLQGSGQLEHLADLLPLGEDRVSGHFAADISVGGTVAAPAANGRLRLSDARYENFATGAVLTNMQADLVGDRDRFTLTSFSAGDSASGSLKAQGNVVLAGRPRDRLPICPQRLRISVSPPATRQSPRRPGRCRSPVRSPRQRSPHRSRSDRADINLPDSLPPNVVVIKVTEDQQQDRQAATSRPRRPNHRRFRRPSTSRSTCRATSSCADTGSTANGAASSTITGTSAAPAINGSLEQIRGSVDLLGKTFTLTRGRIIFDGSDKLDPVLDIVAEASTADITAQVNIGGLASAPTITLTSTPVVPQDEVLSRVLFGKGVGQITPGEGLQLAAAAATLAGGGPGVLDRLRGGLGLDWFKLGSGASSATTGTLNPRAASGGAASGSATGGTALSAGKYIAPGVSVGVSQGISPPTSKVTVEIEVRPHLTIGGEAGQSGGTGLGMNWNYDY